MGGKAVAIGTDSPDLVARLGPWRIDDAGDPTDYCLELAPEPPAAGRPRPLPGLYHGSNALLRSRDTDRVTTTLLRVLASHGRPAGEHQARVALMPVILDEIAMLVPRPTIAAVPDRWLQTQGIEAVYTVSSLVDAATGTVLIDPPLGAEEPPQVVGFGGWWLPSPVSESELSPGFAVAEVMSLVMGVNGQNAAATLQAVARLVERAHPDRAPTVGDGVKENLIEALRRLAAP